MPVQGKLYPSGVSEREGKACLCGPLDCFARVQEKFFGMLAIDGDPEPHLHFGLDAKEVRRITWRLWRSRGGINRWSFDSGSSSRRLGLGYGSFRRRPCVFCGPLPPWHPAIVPDKSKNPESKEQDEHPEQETEPLPRDVLRRWERSPRTAGFVLRWRQLFILSKESGPFGERFCSFRDYRPLQIL